MRGLMQHDPLVVNRILERGVTLFPRQEIVTWAKDGVHRQTFAAFGERVGRLASALAALGVAPGDRVATFAFNTFRHQELYFAVPCMGAVLHTLNIRLGADQTAWIANHAEDRVVFVDAALFPAFAAIAPQLESVRHVVVMGGADLRLFPSSSSSPPPRRIFRGRSRTRTMPPRCATRAARQASRKASSTRIGRRSCTRRW
jgi:fatty-acyl-CoA synthase